MWLVVPHVHTAPGPSPVTPAFPGCSSQRERSASVLLRPTLLAQRVALHVPPHRHGRAASFLSWWRVSRGLHDLISVCPPVCGHRGVPGLGSCEPVVTSTGRGRLLVTRVHCPRRDTHTQRAVARLLYFSVLRAPRVGSHSGRSRCFPTNTPSLALLMVAPHPPGLRLRFAFPRRSATSSISQAPVRARAASLGKRLLGSSGQAVGATSVHVQFLCVCLSGHFKITSRKVIFLDKVLVPNVCQ